MAIFNLKYIYESSQNNIKFKGIILDNNDSFITKHNKDIKEGLKLLTKKWNEVLDYASDSFYSIIKQKYQDEKRFNTEEKIRKYLKVDYIKYEGFKLNNQTGHKLHNFTIGMDTNPSLDGDHIYMIYVNGLNIDNDNIHLDDSFDG